MASRKKERTDSPAEAPEKRDESEEQSLARYATTVGIVTGLFGMLFGVGFILLPAATMREKVLVIGASLAVAVADLTGVPALFRPGTSRRRPRANPHTDSKGERASATPSVLENLPGHIGARLRWRRYDSFAGVRWGGHGFAADPEQAIRQAIAIWADTTASVGIELAERQGRLAGHFGPGEAECFPGWHTIIGGITGWGLGDTARAKRQWLTETLPWVELAPVITTGLTRDYYNAVRIFIGQGDGFSSCEVVINGVPHQAATAALAAMGWPRTEQMSTAKVFLLLVQPTGATQNG
jgi:hypothetical protein